MESRRRFVVVQQPFDCREDEANKFNISQQVLRERLTCAINGYTHKKSEIPGIGGSFTYARVGRGHVCHLLMTDVMRKAGANISDITVEGGGPAR